MIDTLEPRHDGMMNGPDLWYEPGEFDEPPVLVLDIRDEAPAVPDLPLAPDVPVVPSAPSVDAGPTPVVDLDSFLARPPRRRFRRG